MLAETQEKLSRIFLSEENEEPRVLLELKLGGMHTLIHRATMTTSISENKQLTKDHIKKALTIAGYPKWNLPSVSKKITTHKKKERSKATVTSLSLMSKL